MVQPVKILFLDIGGVLLTNGWGHASRKKAATLFNLDQQQLETLHTFIFNIYEIGQITLDEYLDTVIFHQEREFTRQDFKTFMFEQSAELPNMLQWIIEWKKTSNFRVISINNEGRELNDYRIKKFKLHQCFDAFVSSCDVGMRKPDPGIFKLAAGIAQVAAKDCLYFDDREMLVAAACKTGLKAYHHQDFETTKSILENL